MKFTDSERLDFLEKWEPSIHQNSWFTVLTQNISREDCSTLRSFCDYGINFEKMLDLNGIDVVAWHYLPIHLMESVITIWEKEARALTIEEKLTLQKESDEYWKKLTTSDSDLTS